MRTLLRARTAALAVPLLFAATAWAFASTTAEPDPTPAPTMISNCTYYNNAQHTHIVGQFGFDCCNNPVAWGRKTAFSECGGCFICFPPPP